MLKDEELTGRILDGAIEVHRELGPGLLESAYEECLCRELTARKVVLERQKELPLVYKGELVPSTYRVDLLIDGRVVVELKSVESLLKVHEAQELTYMRMGKFPVGLLINFNVPVLKDGIRRFVI